MITILKSAKYQRERNKFVQNDSKKGILLIKALDRFTKNPNHPSLSLEKLSGTNFGTIRIDRGNRIFFYWIDKSIALFVDIGEHDKYRKY